LLWKSWGLAAGVACPQEVLRLLVDEERDTGVFIKSVNNVHVTVAYLKQSRQWINLSFIRNLVWEGGRKWVLLLSSSKLCC